MSLSRTLSRLREGQEKFASAYAGASHAAVDEGRLTPLAPGFANPGHLRALSYVPAGLKPGAGLVVVLHGCTQNAAGYDRGAGWSRLAERHGFALLYPEQTRTNNSNLCFNWYEERHATRGRGEAASIAAMVGAMQAANGIAPDRVFVTGLSAGGAMAAVMLAAYPELFAAGAVIAGLPFGVATNLSDAFSAMAGGLPTGRALSDKVRAASPHRGAWPRLSLWHGSADTIVSPANSDALLSQWAGLHGVSAVPTKVERVNGHSRKVWLDPAGREVIERYDVAGMAHGTPLAPGQEVGQSGVAGPHMLSVGLSSTDRIAHFFGVGPAPVAERVQASAAAAAKPAPRAPRMRAAPRAGASPRSVATGVQKTIEDALRSAGLM